MSRIVHFEIQATEPEHLGQFYTDVFAWQIKKWEGPKEYWLITTGPDTEVGINGAITLRQKPSDASASGQAAGYICVIDVVDIEHILMLVTGHGGEIVTPKQAVPGVGWSAYCADPEGTIFGLMQADQTAV